MEMKKVHRPRKLYEDPERTDEYVSAGDIVEFIRGLGPPGEFKPGNCFYNRDGDLLEVYWKPDSCYAETCGGVTLMRSFDTKEVVGILIHRARAKVGLREVK